MSRTKVVVLGCGGHGRVARDILSEMDNVTVVGFVDDNAGKVGTFLNNTEVLGTSEILGDLLANDVAGLVLGIGDNLMRAKLFSKWKDAGFTMFNAIHPSACISQDVILGEGIIAMPGIVINTGSRIGNDVCINTGATLDHDNSLNNHTHIYPGATLTGGVTVGCYSYVGANATVNPYVSIGTNSRVSSGSVVTKNVPDNVTVIGVPARIATNSNL